MVGPPKGDYSWGWGKHWKGPVLGECSLVASCHSNCSYSLIDRSWLACMLGDIPSDRGHSLHRESCSVHLDLVFTDRYLSGCHPAYPEKYCIRNGSKNYACKCGAQLLNSIQLYLEVKSFAFNWLTLKQCGSWPNLAVGTDYDHWQSFNGGIAPISCFDGANSPGWLICISCLWLQTISLWELTLEITLQNTRCSINCILTWHDSFLLYRLLCSKGQTQIKHL